MIIGICDDNQTHRNTLKEYCCMTGTHQLHLFSSAKEVITSAEQLDLLFLDIEMPEMDGINLKQYFEQKQSKAFIIFCTSHDEFMPDAFGKNVIGFLRKPIHPYEIKRYIRRTEHLLTQYHILEISPNIHLSLGEILYVSVDKNYTLFHTENHQEYSSRRSLKDWCEKLIEFDFYPIHRNYIVNLSKIHKITQNKVLIKEDISLPVSRRKKSALEKAYYDHLMS